MVVADAACQAVHLDSLTMTELSGTVISVMSARSNPPVVLPAPGLTIDELARRVDMTVRNLREWRTLGLLPPARMRGRVGYYDVAVVERVGVIRTLHAEGFTLELIRQMLASAGDSADEVLQLAERMRAPFREDDVPVVSVAEWKRQWRTNDPAHVQRAIDLGLLRRRDDKRLEFSSARLARVGETLRELGMSVDAMLDATAAIRSHADGLAAIFEQVWRDEVWEPLLAGERPEATFDDLQATLAKLQPAAINAVIGLFIVAMDQRIAEGITREIEAYDADSSAATS
jgi:DNA-binding transcriptional MerR regulator